MDEGVLYSKAKTFAKRIVLLYRHLETSGVEDIRKQILRSGTSIGSNIAEAQYAASNLDFINKLKISEKEAAETAYWLEMLSYGGYINDESYISILSDLDELQNLLGASLKTAKLKVK